MMESCGVGQAEVEWAEGADEGPDGLVGAPRKVERVAISYAQASKQVHIHGQSKRMDTVVLAMRRRHLHISCIINIKSCRLMYAPSRRPCGAHCRAGSPQKTSPLSSPSRCIHCSRTLYAHANM